MKTNKSLLFYLIYVIVVTLLMMTINQIKIYHIILWYLSFSFLFWFLIKLLYYDLVYQDINELENKIKNNDFFYVSRYNIHDFILKHNWSDINIDDRMSLVEKNVKYTFIGKTFPIFWLCYIVVYFLSIILYVLENLWKYLSKKFIKLFLIKTI